VADAPAEITACVNKAARDHRFLPHDLPEAEWSSFLSDAMS
jgi:hypothetical protein